MNIENFFDTDDPVVAETTIPIVVHGNDYLIHKTITKTTKGKRKSLVYDERYEVLQVGCGVALPDYIRRHKCKKGYKSLAAVRNTIGYYLATPE